MSIDIKRLRELMEKATPGPWVQHPQAPRSVHQPEYQCWIPALDTDAELIAAMRNALPALLAAWEDAERYRALIASGKYAPDRSGYWALQCGPRHAYSKDEMDASIDAAMGDKP